MFLGQFLWGIALRNLAALYDFVSVANAY